MNNYRSKRNVSCTQYTIKRNEKNEKKKYTHVPHTRRSNPSGIEIMESFRNNRTTSANRAKKLTHTDQAKIRIH